MGLPSDWDTIETWINDSEFLHSDIPQNSKPLSVKNPEIPVLPNYNSSFPESFWEKFPENFNKKALKTVNVKILKKLIQKCWFQWTLPQRLTAKRTLRRLQGLEKVKLSCKLKKLDSKNAKSALENGKFISDAIATWIKKGYVVGPYKLPPLKEFRVNPLMAAVQRHKVRPILNLSSPKENSFNSAVDPLSLEKLEMSSPKLFAEALKKAGKGALFSKSDIVEAYKLIPNAIEQYRMYGFKWGDRYFYDKTTVFGSRAAPAFFDSLPETIVNIVCTLYKIPKNSVLRQIDDVPMVASKESGMTEKFTYAYKDICEKINIPLAPECPDHEKAFGPSTFGTVLGIQFDSELMEWSISKEKEMSLFESIDFFLYSKTCTLKQVQKLHGKLANFAQAHEFMKGFRFNILALLNKFEGKKGKKLIPEIVKHDLNIWKKCI